MVRDKIKLEEMPKWLQKFFMWNYKKSIKSTLKDVKSLSEITYKVDNLHNSQEWLDFQDELNKYSVQ
jgi:hypothetical protein